MLREGFPNAINHVFLVLAVVSVYMNITGTREIVPYEGIPSGLGDNADRVQDWVAHFFTAGNTVFILKFLKCCMRSSHRCGTEHVICGAAFS
jgi:hypothetical protein